jgi:hypothetical protein
MVGRTAAIGSISVLAVLCDGCGTSSGPMDRGESPSPEAGSGQSSGSGAPDAGPLVDASSSGPNASGDDAGAGADGARPSGDAASGDSGVQPYKGVANSACADLARLGVTWWYNWTLSPSGCAASEFVPMIWGHTGKEQTPAGVATEISGISGGGYRTVLGFNEPDNTGQSNMSVATAISLWPSFDDPSLRVGSPATQGNGSGLTWIQNFMGQVNADAKLRVDFIATHWYGWNAGSCDAKAANLESWIKGIEAIPGDRPIWLTEWGCLNDSNPDAKTVQAFFSGAIAMFARHPRIERYAWYPWTTNNELVDADGGALTSLGTVFAAAPSAR